MKIFTIHNKKGERFDVLIDDADFAAVAAKKWHVMKIGYPARDEKRRKVYLHRFLLGEPSGMEVDHVNGDKLDNRRSNLRICTHKQNGRNRASLQKRNTSGHHGVHFAERDKRWIAYARDGEGRRVHIGSFIEKEDAIFARRKYVLHEYGEFNGK